MKDKQIIAKQKELIKHLSKLLHSYKYEVIDGNSKWQRLESELSALESEPDQNIEDRSHLIKFNDEPDIDLAEMSFNDHFEKELKKCPSDYDIENASTDYLNELHLDGVLSTFKQRIRIAYQQGAKDMRDNNIYISPKPSIK